MTLLKRGSVILAACVVVPFCGIEDEMQQRERTGRANMAANESGPVVRESDSPLDRRHTIEGAVTIHRPIADVYQFYRDFRNLPRFLGDVTNIESTGPATWRWTIQGPLGVRIHWTVKVAEDRANQLIRYETVTTCMPKTRWEIWFSRGQRPGETEVREVMSSPLRKLGRIALAVIGKFPAEEVSANLNRLKQLMETGTVTDTSYSVAGKFTPNPNASPDQPIH